MELKLRDKNAFVAGSSKGIGFAVAEGLAREGVNLFLTARNGKLLEEKTEMLRKAYGVKTAFSQCDLSTIEGVQKAVDNGLRSFEAFDVVIANCGGPKSGRAIEVMDDKSLQEGFEQTFLSSARLIRAFLPKMLKNGWGRIVAISSVSVFEPIEHLALSNTFRSGLAAFLKTLSREVAKNGITVNAVCPGYTKTERLLELSKAIAEKEKSKEDEVVKKWKESIPMNRLAEPEEIANTVLFLCSEKASYITGVSLPVDGGILKGTLY